MASFSAPISRAPVITMVNDLDPAPPFLFGRDEDVKSLMGQLGDLGVLIHGEGGVGKSALALTLANEASNGYPDGCIQLDIGAYGDKPTLGTDAAIRQVLSKLGFDTSLLPEDHEFLTTSYRSIVRSLRILLVVDNVVDPDTVFHLSPGPGSALIATSRRGMPSLITRLPIRQLRLDRLSSEAAVEMLAAFAGKDRVHAELVAAGEIVRICGRLPLALRIVGGKLAIRGARPLADVVTELSRAAEAVLEERLPDSEITVTTILDWSLDQLPPRQRDLLIALANLPLTFITESNIPALGFKQDDLIQLLNESLIDEMPEAESFTIHDLIRVYLRTERSVARVSDKESLRVGLADVMDHLYKTVLDASDEITKRRSARRIDQLESALPVIPFEHEYAEPATWMVAAVNLSQVANWTWAGGDFASALSRGSAAFWLLHHLGELEIATRVLADCVSMFEEWERSLLPTQSAADDAIEIWSGRIKVMLDAGCLMLVSFAVRARADRLTMQIEIMEDLHRRRGQPLQISFEEMWWMYYSDETPETLISVMRQIGEAMDLEFEDDTSPEGNAVRVNYALASLEQSAQRASAEQDSMAMVNAYETMLAWIIETAEALETVDLLWGVEPPLIRFAHALEISGRLGLAVSILEWVERLYASRMHWQGHYRYVRGLVSQLKRAI
jgi:hypothetical protein